jgi:hypothetical protein
MLNKFIRSKHSNLYDPFLVMKRIGVRDRFQDITLSL